MIPRYDLYSYDSLDVVIPPNYRNSSKGEWCRWSDVKALIEKLKFYEAATKPAEVPLASVRCTNCGERYVNCWCK